MQAMPRKQAFLIGCCWVGTLLLVGCGQESPSSDDDDGRSEPEEVQEIDEEEAFVSIDCDAWQNAPPEPRGCVNQPIYCNDEIESTTFGSTSKLGDDFYLQAGVTPRGHSYQESGDVVYELLLPGDTDAVLSLDTPCADLDLFAMTYRDGSQQCPSSTTVFKESDFSQRRSELEELKISTGSLGREDRMQGGRSYLVVIDGKSGQEGSYRLTVDCTDNGSGEVGFQTSSAEQEPSNPKATPPPVESKTQPVVVAKTPRTEPTKSQSQTTVTTQETSAVPSKGGLILNVEAPYRTVKGSCGRKTFSSTARVGNQFNLGKVSAGTSCTLNFTGGGPAQAKVAFTYSGRPLTCTGVATTMQCR